MKFALQLLAALLLGLLIVALAPAECGTACHVNHVVTPAVVVRHEHVAVVAEAVLVTPVVPVQTITVVVPSYGAGYIAPAQPAYAPPAPAYAPPAPQPAAAVQPAASADCAAILTALQKLDARMSALERGSAAPLMPPAPAAGPTAPAAAAQSALTPAARILAVNCAACHTQGRIADGATLALFDPNGAALKLDNNALQKVRKKIRSGAMPPKENARRQPLAPLTDEQVNVVLDWADEQ